MLGCVCVPISRWQGAPAGGVKVVKQQGDKGSLLSEVGRGRRPFDRNMKTGKILNRRRERSVEGLFLVVDSSTHPLTQGATSRA